MKHPNYCWSLAVCAALAIGGAAQALAGTPTSIYDFKQTNDGVAPLAGVISDASGNLYGTTEGSYFPGGVSGRGIVFELIPPKSPSSSWTEVQLHIFGSGNDGAAPFGGLILDAAGNLYGTTSQGGKSTTHCGGCGVVFKLSPPATAGGAWSETILYEFSGAADGWSPQASLTMDANGNLYGVTYLGGLHPGCCGVVFELSPPKSGTGPWTETILHKFTGGADGGDPVSGLIFDAKGNLYGMTAWGGKYLKCCGVVYQLSPPAAGFGQWAETVLHTFTGPDGRISYGTSLSAPVMDQAGNLYGAATWGAGHGQLCSQGCGVVFELSPPVAGSASWTDRTLHRFANGSDGGGPVSVYFLNGKLFGTEVWSSSGGGGLFVLKPGRLATSPWTITATPMPADFQAGGNPMWQLALDPAVSGTGTFYGTASGGGIDPRFGSGTVFSWTP